jgi:hypothetical protein
MKSKPKSDQYGNKRWYWNGRLHRDDGPAVECIDGHKAWFINGECHRDNGPAIENQDGTKIWCRYGTNHREDGPAVEGLFGHKEYWLYDKEYSFEEWFQQLTPEQQYNYLWDL